MDSRGERGWNLSLVVFGIVFCFGGLVFPSSVALHVGFMYAVRGDLVFGELA